MRINKEIRQELKKIVEAAFTDSERDLLEQMKQNNGGSRAEMLSTLDALQLLRSNINARLEYRYPGTRTD